MDEPTRPAPASPSDEASGGRLLLGWTLVLLGVGLVIGGWFGVSGQPDVARQLSYLVSGGIGGLLAGIVGVGLLVSNDLRRDRERLGRVEAAMIEVRELLAAMASSAAPAEPASEEEPAEPKRSRRTAG